MGLSGGWCGSSGGVVERAAGGALPPVVVLGVVGKPRAIFMHPGTTPAAAEGVLGFPIRTVAN